MLHQFEAESIEKNTKYTIVKQYVNRFIQSFYICAIIKMQRLLSYIFPQKCEKMIFFI